jgi:hypothetical protein
MGSVPWGSDWESPEGRWCGDLEMRETTREDAFAGVFESPRFDQIFDKPREALG